ncbi:MAG: Maf family protein [Candidatus Neomarinimicrobiota bacterium]|nr:Maf family protein [Candidatus Neomarinimicrobiota bacterium]
MEIILASDSPRRKKILSELGYKFIVIPSRIDEQNKRNLLPDEYVIDICKEKAFSVWKNHKDCAVISGDTIIDFHNTIIGKPKSDREAFNMIKELSGKKHYVISGLSLIIDGNINTIMDKSSVIFNDLKDIDIHEYVSSFNVLDKAGAYNIEECEDLLIKKIDGCYHNIVGFPVKKFKNSIIEKYLNNL